MQRRLAPKQLVAEVQLRFNLDQADGMGGGNILRRNMEKVQKPDFTPEAGSIEDKTQRWLKAATGAFCVTYDIAPTNCYTWVKLTRVSMPNLTWTITYPVGTTATEVYKIYLKHKTTDDAAKAALKTTFIAAMVEKVAADATLTGYCTNKCPVREVTPKELLFRWLSGKVIMPFALKQEADSEAGKSTSGAMSAVGLKVGIMGVVGVAMAMM